MTARRFTLVSFHAHPDDEALLTAGTLARAVAEGHRVVIVVATAGEAGLARRDLAAQGLGLRRRRELEASAAAIGAARVEVLDYRDSGYQVGLAPAPGAGRFCDADPETVAVVLARILREERADVLTTYDAAGGYGHPDHVQVHRVGARAAELAGTPVVLEATLDRAVLAPVGRVLGLLARVLPLPAIPDLRAAYTSRGDLTHRIDVRAHVAVKQAAMAAHVSQAGADRGVRTMQLLLRLPNPVARRVLGHEWFREVARPGGGPLLGDVFASLR